MILTCLVESVLDHTSHVGIIIGKSDQFDSARVFFNQKTEEIFKASSLSRSINVRSQRETRVFPFLEVQSKFSSMPMPPKLLKSLCYIWVHQDSVTCRSRARGKWSWPVPLAGHRRASSSLSQSSCLHLTTTAWTTAMNTSQRVSHTSFETKSGGQNTNRIWSCLRWTWLVGLNSNGLRAIKSHLQSLSLHKYITMVRILAKLISQQVWDQFVMYWRYPF